MGEYIGRRKIGFNRQCACTPFSNLPPGIVVNESRNDEPDDTIAVEYSVEITNPNMGDMYLWCCWDLENGTVLKGEHFNFRKIPSEDNLGGK